MNSIEKLLSDTSSILEKLHSKVCKLALLVHKKASNIAVRSELGRYPISINIISQVAKYFINVCNRDDTCIIKDALKLQNILYNTVPRRSWFTLLINITKQLPWRVVYNNENGYIQNSDIKKLLLTRYERESSKLLKSNSKLELLCKVKNVFGVSQYLKYLNDYRHRKAFTIYRISAHKLPIELGRYRSVQRDQRICTLCQSGDIGDEYHYFMKCTDIYLHGIRKTYLKSIFTCNTQLKYLPEDSLFVYLLSGFDRTIVQETAQYIFEILSHYSKICTDHRPHSI